MKIFLFIAAVFIMVMSAVCINSIAESKIEKADFVWLFISGFLLLTFGYFM